MCYLVPGPTPCPEVVAVFYIRPAEVPTLSSVEGDAQVEQQNTVVGFLTLVVATVPSVPHMDNVGAFPALPHAPWPAVALAHAVAEGTVNDVLGPKDMVSGLTMLLPL